MIPAFLVSIPEIPFTSSGKVDRKILLAKEITTNLIKEYIAPRTARETELAAIWEEVLGVSPISIDDNFFDLGGHSLLILKLKKAIDKKIGRAIPFQQVYNTPTIELFAAAIEEEAMEDYRIELDKEAVFSTPLILPTKQTIPSQAHRFLLTGATGFVGAFLLKELLSEKDKIIYCIVRCDSKAHGLSRIKEKMEGYNLWQANFESRLSIIKGDIKAPFLGIDEQEYTALAQEIEVVIHNASYVDHFSTYEGAKPINVLGTETLIHFCLNQQLKPLHYVSTTGVFSEARNFSRIITESASIDEEIHFNSEGYNASKWVGEKLIEKAAKVGLPTHTHRLGLVIWDTVSKAYDPSQWLNQMIKSSEELGAYPAFQAELQVIPVNQLTADLSNYIYSNPLSTEQIPSILHYLSENPKTIETLIKEYYGDKIKDLKRMEIEEWTDLASTKVLPISNYLTGLMETKALERPSSEEISFSGEMTKRKMDSLKIKQTEGRI